MYVHSILAGAIKITGKRTEGALQIRRAAGSVIPGIANVAATAKSVKCRRIEGQRIAIAIGGPIERHARIDTIVEGALDYVGELRLAAGREHSPVPHHVADGCAAFA